MKRSPPESVARSPKKVNTETLETAEATVKEPRLPKRKVAVMLGYCGTGYHGMQLNNPHKTIEGDLFDAFVKAKAISKENSDDPKKSSLIRAARTDKGVHAAGNVVSLKMIIENPDIVEEINKHLPPQIRIWGISRVNKAFECRKCCSSRIYEYLLPSYTLIPPKPTSPLGERLQKAGFDSVTEASMFWDAVASDITTEGVTAQDLEKIAEADQADETVESDEVQSKAKLVKSIEIRHRRAYRVPDERLEKLREALNAYKGVHKFHNFTVGCKYDDPSGTRVMKSLEVGEPQIIDSTEWVSIKIHGQSFMLHQIRKMIAIAVLTVRCATPIQRIHGLYENIKLGIPKAPALGLLLEQPVYDGYNMRLAKLGREALNFDAHTEKMDAFKREFIYSKIYSQEQKENEFNAFFSFIDSYKTSDLLDYLVEGKVPEATTSLVQEPSEPDEEEQAKPDNEG